MLCCTSLRPLAFCLSPGNFRNAAEGRELIEFIYPKNNSYLLMDRAYEDNKTLALPKAHEVHSVIKPKKNRKSFNHTINNSLLFAICFLCEYCLIFVSYKL